MIYNAAGSLQAGALQLSETLGIAVKALRACIEMAYQKRTSSIRFEAVRLEMF